MEVKLWNKIDSINGVEAQLMLESRADLQAAEEVILICDATGRVTNIELPKILYTILGLTDSTLTALQIGQKYVDKLTAEQQAASTAVSPAQQLAAIQQTQSQIVLALVNGGLM